jgi:hypothetical protein
MLTKVDHYKFHQLLEMYNSILNSLERKEMSCFVFCDFSKAFDKVWHHGLLHKLKAYGINGNLLSAIIPNFGSAFEYWPYVD